MIDYLGGCPCIDVTGRPFRWGLTCVPDKRLTQVRSAWWDWHGGLDGDVLVFLPGAGEIRRCMRACSLPSKLAPALRSMALPLERQRRLWHLRQHGLSSPDIAETSLTIDGVTVVVDSRLVRGGFHTRLG